MARTLLARANRLNHRIYASLPFGQRVSHLFLKLAGDILDAFARVVSAEFIKRGVVGMEEIRGEPVEVWADRLRRLGPRAGDALPRGYGRSFAQLVWRIGLRRSGRPDLIEEVMTSVIEKLIARPTYVREGVSLPEAQGLVIKMVKNEIIDAQRMGNRWRMDPLGDETDEGDFTGDMLDPRTLRKLEDQLTPSKMNRIVEDLARVHPSASEYVRLMLEGYTKREIAQGALLPHMRGPTSPQALTNWEIDWLPKIRKVFQRHMETPVN